MVNIELWVVLHCVKSSSLWRNRCHQVLFNLNPATSILQCCHNLFMNHHFVINKYMLLHFCSFNFAQVFSVTTELCISWTNSLELTASDGDSFSASQEISRFVELSCPLLSCVQSLRLTLKFLFENKGRLPDMVVCIVHLKLLSSYGRPRLSCVLCQFVYCW